MIATRWLLVASWCVCLAAAQDAAAQGAAAKDAAAKAPPSTSSTVATPATSTAASPSLPTRQSTAANTASTFPSTVKQAAVATKELAGGKGAAAANAARVGIVTAVVAGLIVSAM